MIYLTKTPSLIYKIYNTKDLWKVDTSEKVIFLTFDDGPIPEVTPWVLDVLDEYEAKATFFCVGENVKRNPDIFNEIIKRNHTVGNHTFNHMNGWKTEPEDYYENVDKCSELISTTLFRPPYGKLSSAQRKLLDKKYKMVYWTVLSGDFDQSITPEKCLENVKSSVENGSIVVFHDSLKAWNNLYQVLPVFLNHFHQQGYAFKSIPYDLSELVQKELTIDQ